MTTPATIGGLRVVRLLGKGGMGAVYLAEGKAGRVVVKVMDPAIARDPVAAARFRREAEAASRVDSPHVVRVLGSGQDRGVAFIVMELVDGPSLSQLVRERGPLAPLEAVRLARDAARGLAAVHAAGFLHRDVKPGNVLVGKDGRARVADFGIAKKDPTRTDLASNTGQLSITGEVLGTADYMAPEQAEGKPIDARADLYALGVTLYELLTARRPFEGNTALAVLAKAMSAPVVPPRALAPGIPAGIEEACLTLMARDRDARPASAEEALALLDRALAASSRRGPSRVALAAGAAAVVLALAALRSRRAPEEAPAAPPPAVVAHVASDAPVAERPAPAKADPTAVRDRVLAQLRDRRARDAKETLEVAAPRLEPSARELTVALRRAIESFELVDEVVHSNRRVQTRDLTKQELLVVLTGPRLRSVRGVPLAATIVGAVLDAEVPLILAELDEAGPVLATLGVPLPRTYTRGTAERRITRDALAPRNR